MPEQKINITIDGKKVSCLPGQTVLEAAAANGVEIPSLCEHPDFPHKANCRVCVVEIKGRRNLATSCSTPVAEGMEIQTASDRVIRSRNLNLEMIFAEHIEKCATCVWRLNCKLLAYSAKYKILLTTFKDRKGSRQTYKFENAVELDGTQCIDCRNCIDACSKLQKINYLQIKGKGSDQEICPTDDKNVACILCGQCAVHCPVSSAQEQYHYQEVQKIIKEGKKTVVIQFAPSIRVSIGEEFNLPYGAIVTEQLVEAMKLLGFRYVFDVNFAADVTTMVEAGELIERIKSNGTMPMLTSCCPAWVRYVEYYRPDLIPNLTTSRSPQIHLGGIIKTFWAEQAKIDPKNIVVVSVMPCTAKKYEAARAELKVDGNNPVDYVLTTRELAFMIKTANIDFAKLKGIKADEPLGEYTGAAALYGGSGGVMESALRTAQAVICGEDSPLCHDRLEFLDARGLDGIKEATVEMGQRKLKVAVINGIGHWKDFEPRLKEFDYIEVMSCPGGCIGGGGEPIPTTDAIRKARAAALLGIDRDMPVREAHKNQGVKRVLAWLEQRGKALEHGVLHTKYIKRR
ncbi:ferredoxin [Candidatus Falkowbacteria bacterium]|nr:ferredoxin [Candidatus Falkowbacteria bacterium]